LLDRAVRHFRDQLVQAFFESESDQSPEKVLELGRLAILETCQGAPGDAGGLGEFLLGEVEVQAVFDQPPADTVENGAKWFPAYV
jgi:hypothetical protein